MLVLYGVLDCENAVHIFVVHYCFLDRINASLQSFVSDWNHHPVRTEHNNSPLQLLYMHQHNFPPPPDVVEDADEEEEDGDDEDPEGVPVEPVECPLNQQQMNVLLYHAPQFTLADALHTLIPKFVHTLNVVNFLLQQN